MSAVWTITKGATALDLLASDYHLADELPLGTVPRSFEVLAGPGVDLPAITGYRTSDARVLPWRCEVYGDDGQDLEDNLNALFDVLPRAGETATITIGRTGGDATAELRLLAVADLDCAYGYKRDMGRAAIVTCKLYCDPFTTSATDTLYSDYALSLPAAIDLSIMTGLHAAPLDVVLNAATADLHQVVMGVYPDTATIADFIHEAATLSWSGGAGDIDANGYTSDVGYTHKVADATTIAAADGSDDATDRALANELKADLNTHMASTTYHLAADTAIATADATDDATFIALTKALDVKWKAHAASATVHGGIADDVALAAVTALALAASPDKAACRTYCNALKLIHAAHLLATTAVGHRLWKTNASGGVYADIDVTDYRPGTYALYSNARKDAGADPATIETAYTDAVTIEGTDLRRQLLGYVSLPCETVRGSATSSLRVTMKSDGTDYVYLNTIEIIPASWGIAGWHHATSSESADELRWSDDLVYADDVASLFYATDDRQLSALGGTLVITGEAEAEAPTLAVVTSGAYDPRWEQFPSATVNRVNYCTNPSLEIEDADALDLISGLSWHTRADDWHLLTDQPDLFGTNLLSTPSFETDTDANGLADDWAVAEDQTPDPTYSLASSRLDRIQSNRYSQRVQCAPTTSGTYLYLYQDTAVGSFAEADPASFSVWVKGAQSASVVVKPFMRAYSAVGTALGAGNTYGDAITLSADTWQRVKVGISSVAATASYVRVGIEVLGLNTTRTLDLYLDEAICEKAVSVSPDLTLLAGRTTGRCQRFDFMAAADKTYAYVFTETAAASFEEDDPVSFSVYLKGTASAGLTVKPALRAYSSAGAALGAGNTYGSAVTLSSSAWTRAYVTLPACPATTDHIRAMVEVLNFDAADTLDLYVDDALIEKKTVPFVYVDSSDFDGQIVFDGDSQTAGDVYPALVVAEITPTPDKVNVAVGGQTFALCEADATTQVDPYYYARRDYNILVVTSGGNEYYGGALAATVVPQMVAYCQARQAAGFKVVVLSCIPSRLAGTAATYDAQRAIHNAYIAANWSTFADAYADYTANVYIGADSSPDDYPVYWDNGIHMSATGYAALEPYVTAAVEAAIAEST